MFEIVPFQQTDPEYSLIVDIWNTVWPERATTVAQMQRFDRELTPGKFYKRWLVYDKTDHAVGFGILFALWWSAVPHQFVIDFTTLPANRRQGAASLFYAHAIALLQQVGCQTLIAQTREDVIAGVTFLERRGFQCKLRKLASELCLANHSGQSATTIAAKMATQGIELVTLPTLQQRDVDWLEKLWQLDWALTQDVPSFTTRTQPTLDEFARRLQRTDFLPEGYVVAISRHNGNYVGLSQVYQSNRAEQWLETGLTGVLRSHRRRGIATAMKQLIIGLAQRQGFTHIRTRNADGNPMYTLNQQLGFQPLPSWLTYEKIIDTNAFL